VKPIVVQSIEDVTGDRCVDIMRLANGQFAFRECRRDPEDSHGWRYLSEVPPQGFRSQAAARKAAALKVGWMQEDGQDQT